MEIAPNVIVLQHNRRDLRLGAVTSNAKVASFNGKSSISKGGFSPISAFSIEKSKQKWHLYCNSLQS